MDALAIENVTKVYGDRAVVDDVSFDTAQGEIFGLLGPNGSGKTTTIRMALDIIRPDSGSIALFGGIALREAHLRIGYLPEERGLYQKSTVLQVLRYLGQLKRLDRSTATRRAEEMLERVGLSEHADKKVQALSRGMTQLVQFAGALLHEPDLIVLDEPFAGLDPLNVQLMKEIIRERQADGATVIFSTHIMSDVEELCQRVVIINDGSVLVYGNLNEIKQSRGSRSIRVVADRQPSSLPGVANVERHNGGFDFLMEQGSAPRDLLHAYLDEGIDIDRFEVALPSLNEIFIEEVSRARDSR